MGLRQPARLSPSPGYGLPDEGALAERGPSSAVLPLLLLFVALAVAAVWFVAVPAFAKPVATRPACEVIVLASGTTKCIKDPTHGKRAAILAARGHATR